MATLDESNLLLKDDDLTAPTTVSYSLPDDGYVYYSSTHGIYADKIYFGCNDSADNWEQVELTAEILDENPQLYRAYDPDEVYEDDAHLISDGALIKVKSGGTITTLILADDLTLHDWDKLTAEEAAEETDGTVSDSTPDVLGEQLEV